MTRWGSVPYFEAEIACGYGRQARPRIVGRHLRIQRRPISARKAVKFLTNTDKKVFIGNLSYTVA